MGDELKVKDVFTKVYRNCPQDKSALIRLIMQVHTNQNIYNKKENKDKYSENDYKAKHENILLDGDFGIGKTTMVEEVAKAFKIPFYKFLFPKIGNIVSSDILLQNFNDIFANMYNENGHNTKLTGIVLIDELEKVLEFDCFNMLDNIISMKCFSLYDENSDSYIILDISNVTFVGEINRDMASEYVSIPNIKYVSFSEVSGDDGDEIIYVNDDELDKKQIEIDEKIKKFMSGKDNVSEDLECLRTENINLQVLKEQLVEKERQNAFNSKVDYITDTPSMWHLFGNHISFLPLSLDSIITILVESNISEYKNLASKLGAEDFLEFVNKEVIIQAGEMILDNPNKLYSVPDVFYKIAEELNNDDMIDLYGKTLVKRDSNGKY